MFCCDIDEQLVPSSLRGDLGTLYRAPPCSFNSDTGCSLVDANWHIAEAMFRRIIHEPLVPSSLPGALGTLYRAAPRSFNLDTDWFVVDADGHIFDVMVCSIGDLLIPSCSTAHLALFETPVVERSTWTLGSFVDAHTNTYVCLYTNKYTLIFCASRVLLRGLCFAQKSYFDILREQVSFTGTLFRAKIIL